MKFRNITSWTVFLYILIFSLSCSKSEDTLKPYVDPAFGAYLSSYTAGTVSVASPVRIRLVSEVSDETFEAPIPEGTVKLEPSIEGETVWLDKQTLEFRPLTMLQSGTSYRIMVRLGNLVNVPEEMAYFEYLLKTISQDLDIQIGNLATVDGSQLKQQELHGTLTTADIANETSVAKILSAFQEGKEIPVDWEHGADGVSHRFLVKNISRGDKKSEVILKVNGNAIGSERQDELLTEIPALGDFKLSDAYVEQTGEQHIVLRFSDPIDPNQDLRGLISIQGLDLTFDIQGNQVLAYPAVRQTGTKQLSITGGIRNILGMKMKESFQAEIAFEQLKPAVKYTGNGIILPGSKGAVLPFEAVGLRAVELTVIRIFEQNIPQFLQVNNLDGNSEIRRVGKPVLKKVVRLDQGNADLTRWKRYTLDLSELINAEPGALYQVKLGFKRVHSAFFCISDNISDLNLLVPDEEENWDANGEESEESYWDGYEDYYSDDYDWSERENPCSDSYYGERRSITRNLLASNIGLIAKKGGTKEMVVIATDIITTEPLTGASIEILDFQRRPLGNGTTDNEGKAVIAVNSTPFLIIATHNGQKTYLKTDDGTSLSVSSFDTRGQTVERGLKGYIYGERGVWRPGDSLHLTFVLEDKDKTLPKDHPVIMELTDPLGRLEKRMVSTQGLNGFYRFSLVTQESAPTGNWNARIRVGGTEFNKPVKIETVKPNRLKINLDLENENLMPGVNAIEGKLDVKWLHGAPARRLNARFSATISQGVTRFEKYPDFVFDDVSRRYYGESFELFDQYLDDEGQSYISARISPSGTPPGVLNVQLNGSVYEEGGDFSTKTQTLRYHPYLKYVGIKTPKGDKARGMLLTDTLQTIEVTTVDMNGAAVNGNVSMALYKIDWKWWWDQSEYGANYVSGTLNEVISEGNIQVNQGKGKWQFEVKYPDWGRYYVRACENSSGHCTGKVVFIDWPGWAGRAQRDNPGGASMLAFSTDKSEYTPGERLRIDIPGSGEGRALVSVENGSKVLSTHWVETKSGENPFFLEVTPSMAPGAYIHVTMLQKHEQTVNDMPLRLYGVVSVKVTDPETVLSPVITMSETLLPESEFSVKVSEKNGKSMTYTVAVVDEGLLDITNYKTPDLWQYFHSREALGVKTWDIYEHVMGAYGGRLERLLAIGGDDESDAAGKKKSQSRFPPVVKFIGPFTLKSGGSATHKLKMPQYVGSVRTMIIAGNEGAYGFAEKATPVRKPLMILATFPRVAGPGEKINLPVNVFAMEKGLDNVNIQVKTSDLINVDTGTKSLQLKPPTDGMALFELATIEKTGPAWIEITATSGSQKATQRIDFQIRNPNPSITKVTEGVIEPGQVWSHNYTFHGTEGSNKGYLEVSAIPPIDLTNRLAYLISYPHGCIEQTTSSVFPQLFVSDIMDLPLERKKEIEANIKAGINRLRTFQLPGGGFSYWPGVAEVDEWGSIYAGHFLLEAQKKGYDIPQNMLQGWKKYQSKMSNSWKKQPKKKRDDLLQAYRLYTLALAGAPETGAMNRMRENSDLSPAAAWRLSAAYAIAGQSQAASSLINGLLTTVEVYNESENTYGSDVRDRAMILETLGILKDFSKGATLIKDIAKTMSSEKWMSTQTTAYCLIAVGKYLNSGSSRNKLEFTYSIDGKTAKATTELSLSQIFVPEKMSGGTIEVSNTSGNIQYVRWVATGTPVKGSETTSQNGLRVEVRYIDTNGNTLDPTSLVQGTSFTAEVSVYGNTLAGTTRNIALTQIFPSGWEILNDRISSDAETGNGLYDYRDIRDDRVLTYFNLEKGQKKTFQVKINAAYAGTYYLPAVKCEAMYDNTISAIIAGQEVSVLE